MERFAALLLDVWREACQHIEIGESLERIAPLLARRMPLDWILVRRIDAARASVETAAAAANAAISRPSATPIDRKPRMCPPWTQPHRKPRAGASRARCGLRSSKPWYLIDIPIELHG